MLRNNVAFVSLNLDTSTWPVKPLSGIGSGPIGLNFSASIAFGRKKTYSSRTVENGSEIVPYFEPKKETRVKMTQVFLLVRIENH